MVPPVNYPRMGATPVAGIHEPAPAAVYPPICERTHWDPTQVFRRTVPQAHVALPVDFRPWTKVCMEYKTTGPVTAPPPVADSVVFPTGGSVFPPQRWSDHIDNESATRRLDQPLRKLCDTGAFRPSLTGDLFQQHVLLPDSRQPSTQFVQELAMPKVLLKTAPYECRERNDLTNWKKADKLFNNATKQTRYSVPSATAQPAAHTLHA